nr:diaminopimelate epimerase [uncultured Cetobacterium sp.]
MKFNKMQGAGNDFLLFDGVNNKYKNYSEMAKKLCDRRFGVGGDGIMIAEPSYVADIQMVYYNSDGTRGEMCGNGIRCFSKYVYDEGLLNKNPLLIETGDGIKEAKLKIKDGSVIEVEIYMGEPSLDPKKIPVALEKKEVINEEVDILGEKIIFSSVLVGVPHIVVICEDLENTDVNGLGYELEKHGLFPKKMNVNFIEVLDKKNIKIKTWERGAGRTLACGTGSCASVFLANKLELVENKVNVKTEGGNLKIELKKDGIYMTGEAKTTFKGEVIWE